MAEPYSAHKVSFTPQFLPNGDGSFIVKPGKPVLKLSIKEAARRAGISRSTIRRLYDSGLVKGERPSPRKTLIFAESLEAHLEHSRDPEFWGQGDVRKKFLSSI